MYSCSQCPDLTFERRSVCERHVFEKHSGFGYRCTGCKKTFNRPDNHQGKCIGAEMRLVKRATGTFNNEEEKEYHRFMGTMAVRVKVSKTAPQSFTDRRSMQFNNRKRSHSNNQENRRGGKIFRTNSETRSVLGELYSNTQEKRYEDSRRVVEKAREKAKKKEKEGEKEKKKEGEKEKEKEEQKEKKKEGERKEGRKEREREGRREGERE